MPLLKQSTPFDQDIERATNEFNVEEDWSSIMNICDNVKNVPDGPKICASILRRKLKNISPYIIDACMNNCGHKFKLEVGTKDFINEFQHIIEKVSDKAKEMIKKWAYEYKDDPSLFMFPALYNQLMRDGHSFDSVQSQKKSKPKSNNPDFVDSKEEEDDIAKAIHLSLKEMNVNKNNYTDNVNNKNVYVVKPDDVSSNYSNVSNQNQNSSYNNSAMDNINNNVNKGGPIIIKAIALYDFEALEDNEISFKAGDEIMILDNSDVNWWKGRLIGPRNVKGNDEGLFPANFVTLDTKYKVTGNSVQNGTTNDIPTNTSNPNELFEENNDVTYIDENLINESLHLLNIADPTGKIPDSPDMLNIEKRALAMGALIDQELEKVDDSHARLYELNRKLNESFKFYNYLLTVSTNPQQRPLPTNINNNNNNQTALPQQYLQNGNVPNQYATHSAATNLPISQPYVADAYNHMYNGVVSNGYPSTHDTYYTNANLNPASFQPMNNSGTQNTNELYQQTNLSAQNYPTFNPNLPQAYMSNLNQTYHLQNQPYNPNSAVVINNQEPTLNQQGALSFPKPVPTPLSTVHADLIDTFFDSIPSPKDNTPKINS